MHHTGIYYALFVYKEYYQITYSVYTCKTVRKSEQGLRFFNKFKEIASLPKKP